MTSKAFFYLLILLTTIKISLSGQENKISFYIINAPSETMVLGYIKGDIFTPIDSTIVLDNKIEFTFVYFTANYC